MRKVGTVALPALAMLAMALPAGAQQPLERQATPTVLEAPALVARYARTITPHELAGHLYFFASDFFAGRGTGQPGQRMAAGYLAAQYRRIGLKPGGTIVAADTLSPETYLQPFTLYTRRLTRFALDALRDGQPVASARLGPGGRTGAAYLAAGNAPAADGPAVFAGYGIADDALGYDDYTALHVAGIDPAGRWLVVLADEPLADATHSLLPTGSGRPSRRWTMEAAKIEAARSRGARGLIVVTSGAPFDGGWAASAPFFEERARRGSRLALHPPDTTAAPSMPVYVVDAAWAEPLFAAVGRSVADVADEARRTRRPVIFDLPDLSVRSRIDYPTLAVPTENVLAFVEGADPVLRDEVIVLTAHLDHEGTDSTATGDRIFNGADDNGSGTVALLEIADAFARARADGFGPRRSVLLLHVSAEEEGLLGSAYYTDVEPVVPLERTVANLNLDMVGRYDPSHPTRSRNYVYVIGSRLISDDLHRLTDRVNHAVGIGLDLDERFNSRADPNRYYMRSDQWNFGRHGVPFLFFFTGTHEDYHRPTDEAHRIDYERLARIARLAFATTWQLANQDARPAVTGEELGR